MATKNCSLSGDSKKRKLFIFARRRRKLDRLRSKRSLQSVSVPQQKFSGLKCYLGKWLNFCCCFFLVTHARSSELCAPRKLGGVLLLLLLIYGPFSKKSTVLWDTLYTPQCYGTPCIHMHYWCCCLKNFFVFFLFCSTPPFDSSSFFSVRFVFGFEHFAFLHCTRKKPEKKLLFTTGFVKITHANTGWYDILRYFDNF